jgi:hypothetical protein
MLEERQGADYGGTQNFSSTDSLKKIVLDKLSKTFDMACRREEPVAQYTTETGFVRAVKLMMSLLWKYTPIEMRTEITSLYKKMDDETAKTDADKLMSEATKAINKMKVADETSLQVLLLLNVVIQYSPLSTEYKEMNVFGDFQDLIKTIRSPDAVKMFSGDVHEE